DGSHGEGGGQILRTSLALSVIRRRPLTVHHIRSGRKKPGLRPQHLAGMVALSQISKAKLCGAEVGSERIDFLPGKSEGGDYLFEIGDGKRSAGSVTLLLQGLLPPLCVTEKPCRLILKGGTHVLWSPPYHYFSDVFVPTLSRMGVTVQCHLERWGWYPGGGGEVHLTVRPSPRITPISLVERGPLKAIRGISAVSNLPAPIATRQRDEAIREIRHHLGREAEIESLSEAPSGGRGSFLFLLGEFEGCVAGFSSLGERGKRAEDVAKEAVDALVKHVFSQGSLDPHLADQVLIFLAMAEGTSALTTTRMTDHLLTNLWVIERFLGKRATVLGQRGSPGRVDFFQ
ncbi:MAG: RNA 3'-phosphate cyclase, partial [Methanomicrobiales archaeon]|nr:RNA 3'-phosphate cyclase [Methanomicrobiales archaeon]